MSIDLLTPAQRDVVELATAYRFHTHYGDSRTSVKKLLKYRADLIAFYLLAGEADEAERKKLGTGQAA